MSTTMPTPETPLAPDPVPWQEPPAYSRRKFLAVMGGKSTTTTKNNHRGRGGGRGRDERVASVRANQAARLVVDEARR